ncbi:MAG: HNH nuclease family protein [Gammaproteobacteria bacterium]|nr:HNH nuclease family protein [Gammaproteobacteria bacterium]
MTQKSPSDSNANLDRVVLEARRNRERREQDYRALALKLYPWVCGRCAREFARENLRELTVHHRNHDHDYNPADGSNWELLCLYCHDQEHSRQVEAAQGLSSGLQSPKESRGTGKPFAGLADLLLNKP